MGCTVESEILRRKGFGKGGDKERCGEVEAERSGDAGGEELGPEVGENVGEAGEAGEAGRVVEEGMDDLGRGKRKRKGSNPFQFHSSHTLFSQKTAKCKEKEMSLKKNREKNQRLYRKQHFSELKEENRFLKSAVTKLTAQLKSKNSKIKSLQAKK